MIEIKKSCLFVLVFSIEIFGALNLIFGETDWEAMIGCTSMIGGFVFGYLVTLIKSTNYCTRPIEHDKKNASYIPPNSDYIGLVDL